MFRNRILCVFAACTMLAVSAQAQAPADQSANASSSSNAVATPAEKVKVPASTIAGDKSAHFGLTGSFSRWQTSDAIVSGLVTNLDQFRLQGPELKVGFVRGSQGGGDWGMSYVRKNISGNSTAASSTGEQCFSTNTASQCVTDSSNYTFNSASLHGVEMHKFVPFGSPIANRLQVGMTFAGGVGKFGGTTTRDDLTHNAVFNTQTGRFVVTPIRTQTSMNTQEFYSEKSKLGIVPLGRVEITVAALLGNGNKLKFGGGFGFPGNNIFSVQLVHLFGTNGSVPGIIAGGTTQ